MSWPIPPSGPWNPGVAMAPNMTMGYTPDQWTLIQQQNWQQWVQWQQQYAQWQAQYGDKYAEQMQAVQAIGVVPPLPPMSCVPPPAPPPPKEPPPPHQNDQPLYSHQKQPPPPVPAPSHSSSNPDNQNNINNAVTQNWSTLSESHNISQNSEALKKLSEEERLFDIQFQKWEEEIEKWKKENVNHPDKQAYSDYEQKFEACRAQLLERRQQMKQKRARLTNNTSQMLNTTNPESRTSVTTTLQNANVNNFPTTDLQTPNFNSNPTTNVSHQNFTPNASYNIDQLSYIHNNTYEPVNPQLTTKSYQNNPINNSSHTVSSKEKSSFLPTNESSKGIPGLDLVSEIEKKSVLKKVQDVIDITEENNGEKPGILSQGPDYSTISKGINSILGDEKIMTILSMMRQNKNDVSNTSQLQSNVELINHQYSNNASFNKSQSMATDIQGSVNVSRSDNEQSNQSHYGSGPKDVLDEHSHRNLAQNSATSMPVRNQISSVQVRSTLLNTSGNRNFIDYEAVDPEERLMPENKINSLPPTTIRTKWIDQPLFTPSIIVEYEHKPLRLKARDFIEPVHTFDYNHKSKQSDDRKKDFEREVDELFSSQSRINEVPNDNFSSERFRDPYYRDYERKTRDNVREDFRPRPSLRDGYDERRRYDNKYEDRKRDDSDKYRRREDFYRDRDKGERSRDEYKSRYSLDYRRDENRHRSKSNEKENRKRDHSKENDDSCNNPIKKSKDANSEIVKAKHLVMIDDLLEPPGREMRPEKIVIILRGLPGSGKSYLAKLIRDKEAEHGGTVRIMSIDDYFMQEGETEVTDPVTGKTIKKPSLKYEYDQDLEESYMNSLKRAFKRSITDGYFTFLIFDAVNEHLKCYADVWNFSRQNGFQVYICTMEADVATCYKRNIHNRTMDDINAIQRTFFPTPEHHIQLDATTLLQSAAIPEVQMEDADDAVTMEDVPETEPDSTVPVNHFGHRNSPWKTTCK
ncbi:putative uncharacterized protein DDB_G0281733 isoform X2 [Battus philenor]|uniref:putative uncharacterized protein DDB_G0281733 isoform X2 n=1 Tax=Battus philenor TaxID=42288 RepID=UPI0035D1271E